MYNLNLKKSIAGHKLLATVTITVVLALFQTACTATAAGSSTIVPAATSTSVAVPVQPDPDAAKPSNPGGVGPALALTGDAASGQTIFTTYCKVCHGDKGVGGVANPGSKDGTVPSLNPIDDTIAHKDLKVFAANIDLFVEHGSKPDGDKPQLSMVAWGDTKSMTPQQIADVIAYVIS